VSATVEYSTSQGVKTQNQTQQEKTSTFFSVFGQLLVASFYLFFHRY